MAETYLVQINMDSLRRNLSQINRWNLTAQEVGDWLRSMNFVRTPRGWLADDAALDRLEPDEILDRSVYSGSRMADIASVN